MQQCIHMEKLSCSYRFSNIFPHPVLLRLYRLLGSHMSAVTRRLPRLNHLCWGFPGKIHETETVLTGTGCSQIREQADSCPGRVAMLQPCLLYNIHTVRDFFQCSLVIKQGLIQSWTHHVWGEESFHWKSLKL